MPGYSPATATNEKTWTKPGLSHNHSLEATVGFEPTYKGFAGLSCPSPRPFFTKTRFANKVPTANSHSSATWTLARELPSNQVREYQIADKVLISRHQGQRKRGNDAMALRE